MKTTPIRKAKARLSKLIEHPGGGENVVIPHGSVPAVRLGAIQSPRGDRKPGALKGKIHICPKFFEPLPQEELDPWE